jgi:hypothetical protein
MGLNMAELFFNAHPEWYDGDVSLTIFKKILPWSEQKYYKIVDEMKLWVASNLDNDCQIDGIRNTNNNHDFLTTYHFRFRTKDDALLFKLAWGGE